MKSLVSLNLVLRFKEGYKVLKGDTLSKIAKLHGMSLLELLKLNPNFKANPDLILVGLSIKVSKSSNQLSKPKEFEVSTSNFKNKNAEAAKEFIASKMPEIKKASKVADKRNVLLKKANVRANKNTKFSVQAVNNDAKLLDVLWKAGFYGNIPYEKAVDGSFGPKSESAIIAAELAGYTVDRKNGTISIKANSNRKNNGLANMYEMTHAALTGGNSLSNTEPVDPKAITWVNPIRTVFDPHYSSNIPFLTALLDLTVSTVNNGYRKLTGKGPESFLVQNPDIYDIPDDLKQILIKFYLDKKEKTGKEPTSFKASDWKEFQGTYTGGNRNLLERAFMPSPEGALEHSLGLWSYYKDAEGNVHAIDTYDWNDGETSANLGSYTKARDFMGRFGTKASETKAQKENSGKYAARTMNINLGKI